MSAVPPDLAFNTAVSFVTNTNWQNYGGESTMSYLVQMAGLTVQNFVSAATGIAHRRGADPRFRARFGQVDRQFLGRSDPRHALRAAADLHRADAGLVWLGMPQTLGAYVDATTLEGAKQTIALGPGRLADRHQDARHQWRRLLQRQRRASL